MIIRNFGVELYFCICNKDALGHGQKLRRMTKKGRHKFWYMKVDLIYLKFLGKD